MKTRQIINCHLAWCLVILISTIFDLPLAGQNNQKGPVQNSPRLQIKMPEKGKCPLPVLPALPAYYKSGLKTFWVLSDGGHEWINWRRYLHQTAQIMFPDCK